MVVEAIFMIASNAKTGSYYIRVFNTAKKGGQHVGKDRAITINAHSPIDKAMGKTPKSFAISFSIRADPKTPAIMRIWRLPQT